MPSCGEGLGSHTATGIGFHARPRADCLVVAAGDLQPVKRNAEGRLCFTFVVDTPVAASAITVVAGRLVPLPGGVYQYKPKPPTPVHAGRATSAAATSASAPGGGSATTLASEWGVEVTRVEVVKQMPAHSVAVTHFAPPGYERELRHTALDTGDCKGMLRVTEEYLNASFPFSSYKQVFVPGAASLCCPFAGGAVFSVDMLHTYAPPLPRRSRLCGQVARHGHSPRPLCARGCVGVASVGG